MLDQSGQGHCGGPGPGVVGKVGPLQGAVTLVVHQHHVDLSRGEVTQQAGVALGGRAGSSAGLSQDPHSVVRLTQEPIRGAASSCLVDILELLERLPYLLCPAAFK